MKSRFILILLFCLTFVHATGQELNFDIKGKDYVYALFEIERPSNWPVIFAVAIDSKDTLHINTNSIDDCVQSVHKNSRSTVLVEIECHDVFAKIWGRTPRTYDMCLQSMINFNYETDKYKTVKKIRFKTGETLILKYTRVFGLVADLEEDHSTSIGLDSKEYPIIRKRSIPISFVTCNKFKDFPFIIE